MPLIPVSVLSPQYSRTSMLHKPRSLPRAWNVFARCLSAGSSGMSMQPALGSVGR
jgi:hypothetical protein